MTYEDHLGNVFGSISEMAAHWGMSPSTLQARLKRLPVEQALTYTRAQLRGQCIQDHLGQEFPSIGAMCEHWGITAHAYHGRLKCGYSKERALTEPIADRPRNSKKVRDHTGQEFDSVSDMCKHWNMGRSAYNARRKSGWDLERALTEPVAKVKTDPVPWKDHLGNEYPSLNTMCAAYGLTHHTFSTRINKLSWDLERALTEPLVIGSDEVADPFGNVFPTRRDMYNYYAMSESIYKYRRRHGMTKEQALTRLPKNRKFDGHLTVKHEIEHPYYEIVLDGVHDVWTYSRIMAYYHENIMNPIPDAKLRDKHLAVLRCAGFPKYEVTFDGTPAVWSYWDIIRYRRDTNFGLSPENAQARPGSKGG